MTETPDPAQVAGQIADALHELEQKAHQANLGILAHLIQLAKLEADNASGNTNP